MGGEFSFVNTTSEPTPCYVPNWC